VGIYNAAIVGSGPGASSSASSSRGATATAAAAGGGAKIECSVLPSTASIAICCGSGYGCTTRTAIAHEIRYWIRKLVCVEDANSPRRTTTRSAAAAER